MCSRVSPVSAAPSGVRSVFTSSTSVNGDVPKAPPGSALPITTGIERDPREPPIPRELVEQDTLDLPKVEAQVRKIAFLRADQHMAGIKMVQTGKAALTLV